MGAKKVFNKFILLHCKNFFFEKVFSFVLQGISPIWLRPLGRFMDKAMFMKICMAKQIEGDKSNSGFIDHICMKNG